MKLGLHIRPAALAEVFVPQKKPRRLPDAVTATERENTERLAKMGIQVDRDTASRTIAQREYCIAAVRLGERVTDFGQPFSNELAEVEVVGEKLDAYLEQLAGVLVTGGGTQRIYVALQEDRVLIQD